MANVFAPLVDAEKEAYEACSQALLGLNEAQQHKVLKELALRLGRELVRPGAVRAAAVAAAARSTGAPAAGRGGGRTGGRGGRAGGKAASPETQAFKNWAATRGKGLVQHRDSLKELYAENATAQQKAEIADASKKIREAWQTFRSAEERAESGNADSEQD